MNKTTIIFFSFFSCVWVLPYLNFNIPIQDAQKIGHKIWDNECKQSTDLLTFWKTGEEWASLGIGHFIWYPFTNLPNQFAETFPALIKFIQAHGTKIPRWLLDAINHGCPWKTKDEFIAAQNSKRMIELRKFLVDTIDLQVKFMVQRLKTALKKLSQEFSSADYQHIRKQIKYIAATDKGIYALIDYLNFKGEGFKPAEEYNGKRWGLFWVLKHCDAQQAGKPARIAFIIAAKKTLKERVENAPRDEKQWLQGWYNRIDTYL